MHSHHHAGRARSGRIQHGRAWIPRWSGDGKGGGLDYTMLVTERQQDAECQWVAPLVNIHDCYTRRWILATDTTECRHLTPSETRKLAERWNIRSHGIPANAD